MKKITLVLLIVFFATCISAKFFDSIIAFGVGSTMTEPVAVDALSLQFGDSIAIEIGMRPVRVLVETTEETAFKYLVHSSYFERAFDLGLLFRLKNSSKHFVPYFGIFANFYKSRNVVEWVADGTISESYSNPFGLSLKIGISCIVKDNFEIFFEANATHTSDTKKTLRIEGTFGMIGVRYRL